MVMSQTTEHIYEHPWAIVSQAFWKKYPNPALPHVEKMEVISRFLDDDGRLHTARLGVCTPSDMPSWAKMVLGKYSYVYEESVCDPIGKTLELKSTNLSYRSVAAVNETCLYTSATETATKYVQRSQVHAHVPLLSKEFERHWVERGSETSMKGIEAMEAICQDLEDHQ